MESTAGFPRGLEAGAFNLKQRGTAVVSQHFLLPNQPVGSIPPPPIRVIQSLQSCIVPRFIGRSKERDDRPRRSGKNKVKKEKKLLPINSGSQE